MKKIIIFGANSAVAQACAKLWAEGGNDLFLVGRDANKLKALEADLRVRSRSKIESRSVDLGEQSSHADIWQDAKDKLGSIDTVLIAHGILGNQKQSERDYQHLFEIMNINLLSTLSLLSISANELEAQGRGSIAVITSVAGDRGRQSNYTYGTSKGAVSIFLSGLRNRLSPKGVAVTDIKMGFVDTPMTRDIRKGPLFAQAETVAKTIVRVIDRKNNIAYTPFFWRWIMLIVKSIPESIFKKLKM